MSNPDPALINPRPYRFWIQLGHPLNQPISEMVESSHPHQEVMEKYLTSCRRLGAFFHCPQIDPCFEEHMLISVSDLTIVAFPETTIMLNEMGAMTPPQPCGYGDVKDLIHDFVDMWMSFMMAACPELKLEFNSVTEPCFNPIHSHIIFAEGIDDE